MRITKKAVSVILAILMVTSLMSVMAVSASADSYVAQVGDTTYETLQEAFDAAVTNGGTVKMLTDTTVDSISAAWVRKNLTLDLNGKTITSTSNQRAFNIPLTQSTFTLIDSGSNGKIYAPNVAQGAIVAVDYTTIDIKGGIIEAPIGVAVYRGTIKMSGGTINANVGTNYLDSSWGYRVDLSGGTINAVDKAVLLNAYSEMTMSGGTINSQDYGVYVERPSYPASNRTYFTMTNGTIEAKIGMYLRTGEDRSLFTVVKGGRIIASEYIRKATSSISYNGHYEGGQFNQNVGLYPAAGYECIEYTPADGKTSYMIVPIGSTVIDTAAEFATACQTGGSYVLGDSFDVSSGVDIPATKTVVLNLNGKTINLTNNWLFENHGNLTINGNGTIAAPKGCLDNYGTATINGGTYTTTINSSGTALCNEPGCTMVINDCTINAAFYAVANVAADLTINGGSFNSTSTSKNGDFAYTIRLLSGATAEINNCTVTGVHGGLAVDTGSSAVINNATISTHESYAGAKDAHYAIYAAGDANVTVKDGSYSSPRYAVYSGNESENPGDTSYVTIEGGSYSGDIGSARTGANASDISVSGGTFNKDDAYIFVADGAFVTKDENDKLVVSEDVPAVTTTVDASNFNMSNSYDITNYELLGAQVKIGTTKADGNDKDTHGVRFVAAVNEGFLKGANIDDYGFVLAKADGGNLTQAGIGDKFSALKYNGGNGEKTASCKGSSNTLAGDYGKYSTSTTYKFVTAAVNGMTQGDQAVARFYIKTTDGNVYYANYINDNQDVYGGVLATMS